jgi:hypothetical protein
MKKDSETLLIYVSKLTHRKKYVFSLFFTHILKLKYRLTTGREEFLAWEGNKISYGKEPVGEEIFFAAVDLLDERGVRHWDMSFIEFEGNIAFFPVYHKNAFLPFDIFAASFYLVSRYEEYLPYKKDIYGRFGAKQSIAYKKKFLHLPLINIWALSIARRFENHFQHIAIGYPTYRFISTIDIDAAWAVLHKGMMRIAGGYLKDLSQWNMAHLVHRSKVLLGKSRDIFDSYDFIYKVHQRYRIKPLFFILFAKYGLNDKNIPRSNNHFKELIKSLADWSHIGIHPSYNSNRDGKLLYEEIEKLEKVLNREIEKSRQHFLKLELPTTYRNLIKEEIYEDYSMGYAARPGFRASIATPFPFFDLELDVMTKMIVYPFAIMDGTLRFYLGLNPSQAKKVYKQYIDISRQVGGVFVSLWHNESLSNQGEWKRWREVFLDMFDEATNTKNETTAL